MRRMAGWLTVVTLMFGMVGLSCAPTLGGKVKAGKAETYDPAIDPADFEDEDGHPLPIDNPYSPRSGNRRWLYRRCAWRLEALVIQRRATLTTGVLLVAERGPHGTLGPGPGPHVSQAMSWPRLGGTAS